MIWGSQIQPHGLSSYYPCGKYSNLYLVQTYGFLYFQLSPTHRRSNLFCPNGIHAFLPTKPVPHPALHSPQWASLPLIQLWTKNNGIILHPLLILVHILRAAHSSSSNWELCRTPGFTAQRFWCPVLRHHSATFLLQPPLLPMAGWSPCIHPPASWQLAHAAACNFQSLYMITNPLVT